MVPFQGRLLFKQYIPNKTHKYGVKVFKLCNTIGYTLQMSIYAGKNLEPSSVGVAERVVMQLADKYLDKGRILVTDNFYTSIPLATSLLEKNTHLIGTLRKNRRDLPKDTMIKKVFFLSTMHDLGMVDTGKVNKNREKVFKPAVIMEYNTGKQGIDLSDQMASYFSPLRRTIKWYHKLAFEILLNTAVVNSWIIFNKLSGKKVQMIDYREQLIMNMLGVEKKYETPPRKDRSVNPIPEHSLEETQDRDARNRHIRRRCSSCYLDASTLQGRQYAQKNVKLVKTMCNECKKFMCLSCFAKHIQTLNKKK
ncbi:piggyBac transposable element-derived protein 1-like [Nilaparvata lugens]|uniref:piggyBac transposable element-derived protein 1-like n=1 Tax=Nilaparvata lugens TaxID=108931 RepID=UPI00193DAD9F|nr:piggyBac transposable element-derived protein 1-like [Nilaparvata lugens]